MSSVVMTGRRMNGSEIFMLRLAALARAAFAIVTVYARNDAQLPVGDDPVARLHFARYRDA